MYFVQYVSQKCDNTFWMDYTVHCLPAIRRTWYFSFKEQILTFFHFYFEILISFTVLSILHSPVLTIAAVTQ